MKLDFVNKFFYKILVFVILLLVIMVISAVKADAAISLNCPGACPYPIKPEQLPGYISNYLKVADTYPQTPAYATWISPSTNFSTTSITVPSGTAQISLSFNTAGAVGFSAPGYATGYNQIVTQAPGFTDIPTNTPKGMLMDNNVGTYGSLQFTFNYYPTGGFTTSKTHTITVPYKAVNNFNDGHQQCVTNTGTYIFTAAEVSANPDRWKTDCPTYNASVNIYVNVSVAPTSTAYLGCTKDTADGNYYWVGQAVDGTAQSATPQIYLAEGYTVQQTITANQLGDVWQNRNNSPWNAYTGLSSSTNYSFKVPINKKFFDGNKHTLQAVLILSVKNNGNDYTLPAGNAIFPQPFSIGPTGTECSDIPSYSFPWLQTRQGDVVSSNGRLIDQLAGLPGSRPTNAPTRDAEYLVMAYIGGNYPFCSDYAYILTNDNAINDNNFSCNNGWGYKPTYLNLGGASDDKVISSANSVYKSLPPACAQEKADGFLPTTVDRVTCPTGAIYKLTSDTLASSQAYTLAKGNITIYREGNLTISNNLNYATTAYNNLNLDTIRDVPNLTIIVKGKVKFASGVTNIDANIYASDHINTCSTFTSDTSYVCTTPVGIRGFLSAKNGFIFARANPGSTNPAESITLYPRALIYPSPVLNQSSILGTDTTTKIDYAEYQPRF